MHPSAIQILQKLFILTIEMFYFQIRLSTMSKKSEGTKQMMKSVFMICISSFIVHYCHHHINIENRIS